jgi:hypothetical protein
MMLVAAVCAMLAGCDYTVPLVKTPSAVIDRAVVGLWRRANDEQDKESLLVLPLGEKEYLVVYPAESKDAMFARGCLCRNASNTLVQLDWFGTAKGKLPDDNRTFQYAAYKVESDVLRLRLLNPDAVAKDIASSDELAKAIADNQGKANLYRDEMVFRRIQ